MLDYSNQHPWEPVHRLDVRCGVEKFNCERTKCCYHVNFLAYCDDGVSNVAAARKLFFAQVWGLRSKSKPSEPGPPLKMAPVPCTNGHRIQSYSPAKIYSKSGNMKSQTSFCCPLPNYKVDHPYLGRCTFCEPTSSKIAHPPSGKHSGAKLSGTGEFSGYLNSVKEPASAVDCITDSDFVYFDCLRDAKFAEVIHGMSSLDMKDKRLARTK